jgi:Na+/H+ antiporter NhaC
MSNEKKEEKKAYAETYLGMFGAVLPMIAMLGSILVMAALGLRSTKNFWSAGFLAVLVGFLVYKDKKRFQEALLEGVQDRVFAFMISCFLLAGVMSKILTASHLVEGLLWAMSKLHMSPGLMPLICFLICMVLSTATGSAAGAMTTAAPVMIPLAVGMGCNVNLICGAILAGSCFGDNLAPISDTTIASSLSQEVGVMKVVKSRFKYSIIAGVVSIVLYLILGFSQQGLLAAEELTVDATYASSLVFLILPILIIVIMLRGGGLFTALLISELLGFIMLFGFGYIDLNGIVSSDGLIYNAFNGMIGSIIFILFIFIMVSLIKNAGVLDAILNWMRKYAKSERSAEVASGAMVSIMGIAISSGTSAITFCGPIIRQLLRPFKIDRARAANILDGLGCGVGYLVPTNPGCLQLAAMAIASGVVAEGYSAVSFVGYNFHSMALTVVFWFAIISGWGRRHETDEELAADGIVIEDAPSDAAAPSEK